MAVVSLILILTGCSTDRAEFDDEGDPLPEYIDYNLHVRGILSDTCFACHGPDERAREADLRLDTEEGAFQPLTIAEGRYAIVRGRPGQSELYRRIISDDPDYMMPTPQSNLSLTEREIAIIRKWIEQGAEYKQHWAFITPEKPELPEVYDKEWPNTPVDYFVLDKLEEYGLQPSPETRKEKLLRRVSFDLTGLPPTVSELQQFLDDTSPNAYEKAVDRLLNSDAYGERMAMEWLDVARYADTHGYQDDGANEMWPWREWVIHAFNRNMPFDEFITWQLAGDLLPDATREQKLATGFNRVHQQSQEGGIIGEEYRVEYVADRVQTTGTAFLGMTMQCARCHDHKYDPVSELEYYEFAAFFDNINEAGQIPNEGASGPTILLPDEETDKLISYLGNRIDRMEQELVSVKRNKTDDFLQWMEDSGLRNFDRNDIEGLIARIDLNEIQGDTAVTFNYNGEQRTGRVTGELNLVDGVSGHGLEFSHGNHLNIGNVASFERTDPFSFSFWINPEGNFEEVPVLVRLGQIFIGYRGYDVSLFNNKVSLRLIHGWPFNSVQALSEQELIPGEWSHVTVTYDGSSRADGIRIYINGQEDEIRIEQNNLFKNIVIYDDAWYSNQDFFIGNRRSFENLNYHGLKLDEIQIYDRQLSPVEVLALSGSDERLASLMVIQPGQAGHEQDQVLFDHFLLRHDDDFAALTDRLRDLRVEKSAVTDTLREVMVMGERLNPRQSYVRERGMYDQIGEEVSPGVPSSILEFPDELPRNRLGLAQWLISPDHPLTTRVLVNRYWQMMFGEGLVDTPEDFGNQGNMPSHPELLDWLAVYFRESGWDLKELLRQIVLSRTYRQSSVTTPEMREQDPGNRLLARGPRYRLQAEMIRDNALVASGLLVNEIGGPSVKPYQPEGLWEETTSGRHLTEYIRDEGDKLYRRSLYTFWKRTSPPPGMTTFDAAMRSHPTVQRGQTSTPLQALNTMNDPQYVEASRLLAERMIREGGEELKDQITFAFLAATSRPPEIREIDILEDLFHSELMSFQEEPERAEAFLNVGDYPADDSIEVTELAARTLIASTILNLDETLTKE
jgi:hypothetical protein